MCMIPVMTDAAPSEENAVLKARLAETEAALADAVEARRRLESIIGELQRARRCCTKRPKVGGPLFPLGLSRRAGSQGYRVR